MPGFPEFPARISGPALEKRLLCSASARLKTSAHLSNPLLVERVELLLFQPPSCGAVGGSALSQILFVTPHNCVQGVRVVLTTPGFLIYSFLTDQKSSIFWCLGGPGRPGNFPKRRGASPPTFLEGFPAARGRPDPQNRRSPVGQKIIY